MDRGFFSKTATTPAPNFRRVQGAEGPLPKKTSGRMRQDHGRAEKSSKRRKTRPKPTEDRVSEIEDRIYDLNYERPEIFKPEHIAIAGAFIEIEPDGKLDILRGYVKPEDANAIKPQPGPQECSPKAKSPDKPPVAIPSAD